MTDEMKAYQAALDHERNVSSELSLAEYRVLMAAKVAMELYQGDDIIFGTLKKALAEREEYLQAMQKAMMAVVEASKAARQDLPVAVQVDYDIH